MDVGSARVVEDQYLSISVYEICCSVLPSLGAINGLHDWIEDKHFLCAPHLLNVYIYIYIYVHTHILSWTTITIMLACRSWSYIHMQVNAHARLQCNDTLPVLLWDLLPRKNSKDGKLQVSGCRDYASYGILLLRLDKARLTDWPETGHRDIKIWQYQRIIYHIYIYIHNIHICIYIYTLGNS